MQKKINETAQFLKTKGIEKLEIGIVLGTGLGGLVEEIEIIKQVDYDKIPNFPVSTVESHFGKLIYGKLNGKYVLAMQGRFHFYEGYTMKQIGFPVYVMKILGISTLLISNAAGAVNLNFNKSDLMLITDHINLFPSNPLIGKNNEKLGTRFPDMSEPYSKKINTLLKKIAIAKKIKLQQGVYVAVTGPNLETRAEYKMIKKIGGDAVGMSTIPEVIAANHLQLPCCAISVLTDECNPENLAPVDIADILKAAAKAEPQLTLLFKELIGQL